MARLIQAPKPTPWTLSPQMTQQPSLWRGVVACWPFWEGGGKYARDISGNGNHLELRGDAAWEQGPTGSRVALDGTGSYLKVASPKGIPKGNAGDSIYFVAVMTFNLAGTPNAGAQNAIMQYHDGNDGYVVRLEQTDGIIWRTEGGNSANQGPIPKQQQVSIVGRWDQNSGLEHEFFVNGTNIGGAVNRDTSNFSSAPFYLGVGDSKGVDPGSGDNTLDGSFDFFAIINQSLEADVQQNLSCTIAADPFAMLRPVEF